MNKKPLNIDTKRAKAMSMYAFLLGLFIPVIVLAFLFYQQEYFYTWDNLKTIHSENVFIWFVELVPFLIGIVFYFVFSRFQEREEELQCLIKDFKTDYQKHINFAETIGQGVLDVEYENRTDNKTDFLGASLEEMRKSIVLKQEKEDKENWKSLGEAQILNELASSVSLENLAERSLKEIISYANLVQGAIFITENNRPGLTVKQKKELVKLKLLSHYAFGRKKYTQKEIPFGSGLIGECAIEMMTIHRTELPPDYFYVKSGLINDQKPTAVLIVPLVANEQLQGVLELTSVKRFEQIEIEYIEDAAKIIGQAIFNTKTAERTEKLLEESQKMTAELTEQQVQLQKNAVEMQAKQEEITETNNKLEEQIKAVNDAQKRQHALLANASEVISIFNAQGEITYETPSILKILGFAPEELVGTNIFKVESPTETDLKLQELFNFVKEHDTESKIAEIPYVKKNGEEIMLEALATNLFDEPAVNGIVINFRDITERLLAEKEQIMRGKMQSLSENSEDIIMRFGLDKVFQYANPSLKKYTGIAPEEVLGKCLSNVGLHELLKEGGTTLIDQIKAKNTIQEKELSFEIEGQKITMHLTAIPESDSEGQLESVLMIAHDITERKRQEDILAKTNKQIKDSINYARRIQDAIIPNLDDIRADLGEVVQYYNPKDVVSGDFPYYYKKGRYAYFAAVDCTGHGVPGAMMSLIGHLILNDILNNDEIYTPAEVLTKLHWGVVRTLKQDRPDNKAADGMDVALCRIDLESDELLYSGAHRPLYHVVGEEIVQYKGDKYPIGGSQYKGLNSFSDHEIHVKKGESVYFFSDGYPDQFGGPNVLKYGPKRIRKGIIANKDKSVEEITSYFAESFLEWTGENKQIDDVLLIGIKF